MEWQLGLTIGALVYAAFMFQLFAFLARDELRLRVLMLAGSALYLLYYYKVTENPLWASIITNGALAAVNLAMIGVVVLERTTFSMSKETIELFKRFQMLSPGQFRRLLKSARIVNSPNHAELTRLGDRVRSLYYVIDGPVGILKGSSETQVDGGIFVGEVAFLTGEPASATVTIGPGIKYMEWDASDLQRLMEKSPKLYVALSAQFNADLVRKVSKSLPHIDV